MRNPTSIVGAHRTKMNLSTGACIRVDRRSNRYDVSVHRGRSWELSASNCRRKNCRRIRCNPAERFAATVRFARMQRSAAYAARRFSSPTDEKSKKWTGPGSNRRHLDFQSSALPTELPVRSPRGDRRRFFVAAAAKNESLGSAPFFVKSTCKEEVPPQRRHARLALPDANPTLFFPAKVRLQWASRLLARAERSLPTCPSRQTSPPRTLHSDRLPIKQKAATSRRTVFSW